MDELKKQDNEKQQFEEQLKKQLASEVFVPEKKGFFDAYMDIILKK